MPLVHDAEHWRVRAKEARALAEQLDDAESRRMMLAIAQDYDKLARRAELRQTIQQPSDRVPRR